MGSELLWYRYSFQPPKLPLTDLFRHRVPAAIAPGWFRTGLRPSALGPAIRSANGALLYQPGATAPGTGGPRHQKGCRPVPLALDGSPQSGTMAECTNRSRANGPSGKQDRFDNPGRTPVNLETVNSPNRHNDNLKSRTGKCRGQRQSSPVPRPRWSRYNQGRLVAFG